MQLSSVPPIRVAAGQPLAEEPGAGRSRWHPDLEPMAHVAPGETITIETRAAPDGQLTHANRHDDFLEFDFGRVHLRASSVRLMSRVASRTRLTRARRCVRRAHSSTKLYAVMCASPHPSPERRSSAQEVFDSLSERISRWELGAGERLTEERLSREFGVSRTPVREALRLLEQAGYVERLVPRGYAVRAIDLATIDQVYTVRTALEELAVELASEYTKSFAFHDLKARARAATDGDASSSGGYEMRESFHEELAALSGNTELLRMLREVDARIFACRRLDSLVPERATAAQREHLEILERLEAGEVDRARSAMRDHIERSRATVRSLLRAGITSISFAASDDTDGRHA